MRSLFSVLALAIAMVAGPVFANVSAIINLTGTVGVPLSDVITTTPNGTAIAGGGVLPPGLTYSIVNGQGILSGTPTQAGSFPFDVGVPSLDMVHTYVDEVFITIAAAPFTSPIPLIGGVTALAPAYVGVPYAAPLGNLSSIPNYIVNGTIPLGLSIQRDPSDQTGASSMLAGTPTQAINTTFQLQSQNAFTNTEATFSIVVNGISPVAGVYWDPTQQGSGYGIQANAQGDKIFIAIYGYADNIGRSSTWLAGTLTTSLGTTAAVSYTGQMQLCSAGDALSSTVTSNSSQMPNCVNYEPITITWTNSTTAQAKFGNRVANLVPFGSF